MPRTRKPSAVQSAGHNQPMAGGAKLNRSSPRRPFDVRWNTFSRMFDVYVGGRFAGSTWTRGAGEMLGRRACFVVYECANNSGKSRVNPDARHPRFAKFCEQLGMHPK
jgi:hypothetical protein